LRPGDFFFSENQPDARIVRQQWNFSPPSSADEREDYTVDLPDATALELTIKPDISGGEAHASLQQLQVAVRTRG
jgi:hypothetical protein